MGARDRASPHPNLLARAGREYVENREIWEAVQLSVKIMQFFRCFLTLHNNRKSHTKLSQVGTSLTEEEIRVIKIHYFPAPSQTDRENAVPHIFRFFLFLPRFVGYM